MIKLLTITLGTWQN